MCFTILFFTFASKPEGMSQKKSVVFFSIVISILLLCFTYFFRWTGNSGMDWKQTIDGDGTGYFAYVDQIFFQHNFGNAPVDFNQINEVQQHSHIKYSAGTALFQLPFVLPAIALTKANGDVPSMNSEYVQKSVSIAAIFYFLISIILLIKLLRSLKIKDGQIFVIISLTLLGTNLLTYIVLHPAMSHVYSFFAISGFLYAVNNFKKTENGNKINYIFLWLGLIYLIRPFNSIVVFSTLLFFNNFSEFISYLKRFYRQIIWGVIVFVLVISIQFILNYLQCGTFFVKYYPNEGFYFLHPEIFKVLFGFRKGLFVYTPLLLIGIIGLFMLFKKSKFQFVVFTFQFVFTTFLISSWWCWTYSDGFGMRPFIDFYPLFILLFGISIQMLSKSSSRIVFLYGFLCMALSLVQQFQYYRQILPEEYMNFAKYKNIFLKTNKKYVHSLGGCMDIPTFDNFYRKLIFEQKFENSITDKNQANEVFDYSEKEFGIEIKCNDNPEMYAAQKCYCEISCDKFDAEYCNINETMVVLSIDYPSGKKGHYIAFPMEETSKYPVNTWHSLFFRCHIPKILEPQFKFNCYIWNKERHDFSIKNFVVKIYKTA